MDVEVEVEGRRGGKGAQQAFYYLKADGFYERLLWLAIALVSTTGTGFEDVLRRCRTRMHLALDSAGGRVMGEGWGRIVWERWDGRMGAMASRKCFVFRRQCERASAASAASAAGEFSEGESPSQCSGVSEVGVRARAGMRPGELLGEIPEFAEMCQNARLPMAKKKRRASPEETNQTKRPVIQCPTNQPYG